LTLPLTANEADIQRAIAAIQAVGKEGDGHVQAIEHWQTIARLDAAAIPAILRGMDDQKPLANNWIRAAVDAIAQRTVQAGGTLPTEALEAHLADRSQAPRSRRLAYEWLIQVDPAARDRWIAKLLDDPSLELRRDAVAHQLDQAKAIQAETVPSTAIALYQVALNHARDLDQVDLAADALRELGQTVDVPRHFGFVMQWQLIGPFDHTDTQGFDQVDAPEQELDLSAEYPGKGELVRWQPAQTEDKYGKVDLNELLGKHKGSCAYAVAFFDAEEARPIELRLGCINANKIWLNGQLLAANHVYHAGENIDQYVGKGQLVKGQNTILLKICQNEQTEEWAQDWTFQLRVCDELGTAVLPVVAR
jgi:hypothetical protein